MPESVVARGVAEDQHETHNDGQARHGGGRDAQMDFLPAVDVAYEGGKGRVRSDCERDIQVDGALDEAKDQWPSSRFLTRAVVARKGW